uniref:hypothetical protein n=1 Tax=Mariniflexile sp. TaxID=1979402 RepID=UPI004047CD14
SIEHYESDFIARILDEKYWDLEGIAWSAIAGGIPSFRYLQADEVANNAALCIFPKAPEDLYTALGFLNSKIAGSLIEVISQTLNILVGDVMRLPFVVPLASKTRLTELVTECVEAAKTDWDEQECSIDFTEFMWARRNPYSGNVTREWGDWENRKTQLVKHAQLLEEENNRIFINAYGLQSELNPEVPESQITLARADREKDCQRMVSYAIGCMMGRYSLDEPGLIYAHAGNVDFEPSRYATLPADADGIVPITDELWFSDDACIRIHEFLRAVWGPDTLEENMAWLAESLGTKAAETPDETIRRYIADKFFKDHLQTYKKRPIYWLFSSGKQGAFQALV